MKLIQLILKKGWLLAIPLLFSTVCFGQSNRFSEFYDASFGGAGLLEGVVALDNGSLIATGNSVNSGTGYRQGHIVLVDENGILLDESTTGHSLGQVNSQAILKSTTGSVYESGYICNSSGGNNYCDFYFSKINPETTDTIFRMVYSRPDTGDLLLNMVQTTPNKILLIGWTYNDIVTTNADLLFITVDTLGNELNRAVYGGSRTDFIRSGTLVSNAGEVLMIGYTKSFGGNDNDSWVLKTDSIGNVEWQMTYNHLSPTGGDGATSLHPLLDGNFIVCGGYDNPELTAAWGYLMKIDSDGNEIWTKRYENDLSQGFWSCEVLDDGSILAAVGQTNNTNDGSQAGWLVKADENGDTLWTHIYNPSSNTDLLRNMLVLDNGDIVMVGFGRGENSTNQDGWILRVDSLGCLMEGCSTVGINEELGINNDELLLYPNPATDVLNITLTDFSARSSVEMTLVDFSGREIETLRFAQGNTQASIDVSGWRAGIYLLSVRDENGNVVSKRVVKE